MCSVRWYAMKITLYTPQNSLHSTSCPVDCLKIKMSDFFTLTGHAKCLRGMTNNVTPDRPAPSGTV